MRRRAGRMRRGGTGFRRARLAFRVAALALLSACASPPSGAPAGVAPAPGPPQPPVSARRGIEVCVVQDGELRMVTAQYDPATGDTTFGSEGWRDDGADAYAGGAAWYVDGAPIPWRGLLSVKYGPERILSIQDLERAGEHRGVPVFMEAGNVSGVIYVPVRPGCVFQPYQVDYLVGEVRGG